MFPPRPNFHDGYGPPRPPFPFPRGPIPTTFGPRLIRLGPIRTEFGPRPLPPGRTELQRAPPPKGPPLHLIPRASGPMRRPDYEGYDEPGHYGARYHDSYRYDDYGPPEHYDEGYDQSGPYNDGYGPPRPYGEPHSSEWGPSMSRKRILPNEEKQMPVKDRYKDMFNAVFRKINLPPGPTLADLNRLPKPKLPGMPIQGLHEPESAKPPPKYRCLTAPPNQQARDPAQTSSSTNVAAQPSTGFLHQVDIMRSERTSKEEKLQEKNKRRRGGRREKEKKARAAQRLAEGGDASEAKPSESVKVCMNCGLTDHPELADPSNCPNPPATDEFIWFQMQRFRTSNASIMENPAGPVLPQDDHVVRAMINEQLTGYDELSVQLRTAVPSGDVMEQLNWNLCKLCFKIGHLAPDCMNGKADDEYIQKMRLLIKLFKRKRILDAKDAGFEIKEGNIVEKPMETAERSRTQKEYEQARRDRQMIQLGFKRDIRNTFVSFQRPDQPIDAAISVIDQQPSGSNLVQLHPPSQPPRLRPTRSDDYYNVKQLPGLNFNEMPGDLKVLNKIKMPVLGGNKVIGFATPKVDNWQKVDDHTPTVAPGWMTQPNVMVDSEDYDNPVTMGPGRKPIHRPSRLAKKARQNLKSTRSFTVCMNCAQRGHYADTCTNKKLSAEVVTRVIREAEVELKMEEENEIITMMQRELTGYDKLSMLLKQLAPAGKYDASILKLCKNCAKIAHKSSECMAPTASREEVKHMEMLLNLHRKHYAIYKDNYVPYWL